MQGLNKEINLNGKLIGEGHPAYIIASMGANHMGDLDVAKSIIRAAKEAGADCVKIQTYEPETLTINCDNKYFKDIPSRGETLYHHYSKCSMPLYWIEELFHEAKEVGIDIFSTAYDYQTVDFLEDLDNPFYKVCSYELTDLDFILYAASTGKPLFVSTGMAAWEEIYEAVETVIEGDGEDLCLMISTGAFPSSTSDMHLANIRDIKNKLDIPVGLCDHSIGSIGAITAVAYGADVIEKNICLTRDPDSADAPYSMTAEEFKEMVDCIRDAERAIGDVEYGCSEADQGRYALRRSLFVTKDVEKGEFFTEDNIRSIRPGNGIAPKYYRDVLTMTADMSIKKGTPFSFDMVQPGVILALSDDEDCFQGLFNGDLYQISHEVDIDMIKTLDPSQIIIYKYKYEISEEIEKFMDGRIARVERGEEAKAMIIKTFFN